MNWHRLLRLVLVLSWLTSLLVVGVAAQSGNPESKVTLKNPPTGTVTSNMTSWMHSVTVGLEVLNVVCAQPGSTKVRVDIIGVVNPLGSAEREATHRDTATPGNLTFAIPAGEYLQQPYVAEQASTVEVKLNDTEPRTFTFQVHLSAFRALAEIPNCYGTTDQVQGSNAEARFDLVLNDGYTPPEPPGGGNSSALDSLGILAAAIAAFWGRRFRRIN